MCKNTSPAPLVQIGYLDNDAHEIIDLINLHDLPADFLQWLSKGNLSYNIVQEQLSEGKYTQLSQYSIQNALVCTERVEFDLKYLNSQAIQLLTQTKLPLLSNKVSSQFGLGEVKKEVISKISTELHYTVISQLCNKDEPFCFSWEIYELPKIIDLYNKLNDPLRYWRNNTCS